MSTQCEVCLKPEADYIANKVAKKELSSKQAAVELDVEEKSWILHYENHIRKKLLTSISTDIEPIKKNFLDKVKTAHESLDRLIGTTQKIHALLENEDNQMNTRLISSYAALEKNVISGLKECALLEGEITAATTINIQNNTIKVDKLMAIVMEDAPPVLQAKILKKLEELDNNVN